MSARCLAAGQNDAYDLLLGRGSIRSLDEGDFLLAIRIREQCLDLFLVCNRLGCFTLLYADLGNAMSQHSRQLRFILESFFLKR